MIDQWIGIDQLVRIDQWNRIEQWLGFDRCPYFHIFHSDNKFHFIEMMYVGSTLTWVFTVLAL